jgi:hypothetical protein
LEVRSAALVGVEENRTRGETRKALTIAGVYLSRSTEPNTTSPVVSEGMSGVVLPAARGSYLVRVNFAPVQVDEHALRHALDFQLLIDGRPLSIEAPLEVTSVEPLLP